MAETYIRYTNRYLDHEDFNQAGLKKFLQELINEGFIKQRSFVDKYGRRYTEYSIEIRKYNPNQVLIK